MMRRLAVPMLLLPAVLQAQDVTIAGVVRSTSLAPVPGALVSLPRLGLRTIANDAGAYRLVVPSAQARDTIRATSIGYRPAALEVDLSGGSVRLDLFLVEQAIALDELLVAGTPVTRERRAQPAVVDVIDAAAASRTAPGATLARLLDGQLPGFSVTPSSGSVGAAPRLRARGSATVLLDNAPLVVIDGVRADARTFTAAAGGQATSRLNDLEPDDIERIEVVKGPAAATLYGADASVGVVQIVTRRGRPGSGGFAQTVSAEYGAVRPNWTPPANFATCGAGQVAPDSPALLCRGQAAGAIVEDNPLVRERVLRNGSHRALGWSGRGGGDSYGYYLSLRTEAETGTLPQNRFERLSARANVDFLPRPDLSFDVGLGLARTRTDMPQNGDSFTAFLAALIGNPLSVGPQGTGWPSPTLDSRGIAAAETPATSLRVTPTINVRFSGPAGFAQRLTLGVDLSHTETAQFFPRNDERWYGPAFDGGFVAERRNQFEMYTIDYAGSLDVPLDAADRWATELSWGGQLIGSRTDDAFLTGRGLVTNDTRSVSAAAVRTGTQSRVRQRSTGWFVQGQLARARRAFLELGVRVDRSSTFGEAADAIVLPRVGASWVISDEPFWTPLTSVVNTLRLRAAWGSAGRLPAANAALRTFAAAPYITPDGQLAQGFTPSSAGNAFIRAEHGRELEMGLDAATLDGRVGIELTWFEKVTRDLLLSRPEPPSSGFPGDPLVNLGEVVNRGIEGTLHARLVERPGLSWDARITASTLHNELTDLGGVEPFGDLFRFSEGRPLGAYFTRVVRRVDEKREAAIVSDTAEFAGNPIAPFEGSFATTATAFGCISISTLFGWKTGWALFDVNALLREQVFGNAERRVRAAELPLHERLRRFGPFVTEDGAPVNPGEVSDVYVEDADFLRWKHLAVRWTLPGALAARIGASTASLTLAGDNLALWSAYEGADPEVVTLISEPGLGQFSNYDIFVMPQPRRWSMRLDLSF